MENADDVVNRNERLLNLRELDLEIKQRELDLALHLNDLEERESALMKRKTAISSELEYELALELARVESHEKEMRARHDALEVEFSKREEALAKRELIISEREWTLRAKEDEPKGEMAKVYGALNLNSSERYFDSITKAEPPSRISGLGGGGSIATRDRMAAHESRKPAGVKNDLESRIEQHDALLTNDNSFYKAPQTDSELADLAAKANDLRRHLAAARLSADLNRVKKLVDETANGVMSLDVRCEQNESRIGADHSTLLEAASIFSTEEKEAKISTSLDSSFKQSKAASGALLSADPVIRALQLEAQAEKLKSRIRHYERKLGTGDVVS